MSNVVTYIVKAVDQFSSTYQKMNASLDASETKISRVNKSLKSMGDISKNLALKISAPLAGFATFGINEFLNEKKAFDEMRNTLTRLGAAAPFTFKQITDAANGIELKSIYQADDVISKVTNKLVTLGTIAPENIMAAQDAIVNFAAKSGMSLESATSVFTRALQAPATGTMFLERQLGKLTPAFKEHLKVLVESGQTSKAQALLLEFYGQKLTGAAEAAKENAPFIRMAEAINRVGGVVGEQILPTFNKFIIQIETLSYKFAALSPGTKDLIIKMAAIAITLPIVVLAVWGLVVVVKALAIAFLLLTSPIALFILLIAALALGLVIAYKRSEPFRNFIDNTVIQFKRLISLAGQVKDSLANLFTAGGQKEFKTNFTSQLQNISFMGLGAKDNILPTGASSKTAVEVNLNVNDPGKVIKSAETKSKGSTPVDVGTNMKSAGAY